MPAVTYSLNPHTLGIDPQIASDGCVCTVEDILAFIPVLVAKNSVRKLLPVTRGAAVIHVEHCITVRSVDLVLEVEPGAVRPVRPSMNHHDERVPGSGRHANGFGQKRFYLEPVVVAYEGEGLDFSNGLITQ